MAEIWYNSDEVRVFHPAVEQAMREAIQLLNLENEIALEHHPTIPNSTIIPDFALKLVSSGRYIFVLEVKRTPRDVLSQRYQNQARSYVSDFSPYWEPGYQPYFALTNIEELILFADRNGPITNCVLKGNPHSHVPFDPETHNADRAVEGFKATMVEIIRDVYQRTRPQWDDNWAPIIQAFYENYISIRDNLQHDKELASELTLFELFRLLAFSFLKSYYQLIGSDNIRFFRNLPRERDDLQSFIRTLSNAYSNVLQLDFSQVFQNYPDNVRLFPDNLQDLTLTYFKNCIRSLSNHSQNAVSDNHSPEYIYNMLTSKVYDKETMHKKGKIMTDRELAALLATVTIKDGNASVLDPCCGDGALLDAAYDYLKVKNLSDGTPKTHNELLGQVAGIDIDPFLSQLATFRIVAKNLIGINRNTEAEITIGDTFLMAQPESYDVVLMNPPFLRNDNKHAPISDADKRRMLAAINANSPYNFVNEASQPNLYFYFVNYVWSYLNDGGRAGLILMAKFLNSLDGGFLKQFILDKVESIILYPASYFSEFRVTTVVVTLSKNPEDHIKFLRVKNPDILATPDDVLDLLQSNDTVDTPDYSRYVANRNIDPESNWRLFLVDALNKYESLSSLDFLVSFERFFGTIKRGGAENSGGAKTIFPDFGEEPYSRIHEEHRGYGVKNSKAVRSLILRLEDLKIESAIHFPASFSNDDETGLQAEYHYDQGLLDLYRNNGIAAWRNVVNAAFRNQVNFDILIPRAERTKHKIYYNPHNVVTVLSTNFFYLSDFIAQNREDGITDIELKLFIVAFLNSCFGQIQFEIDSNNQEGARKLEGLHISSIRIPDLSLLGAEEVRSVIEAFEEFSDADVVVSGEEGIETERRSLDLAVASVLFERNNLNFNSVEEMVDHFELFLADLVYSRRYE